MTEIEKRKESPVDRLKKALDADSVQAQFKNALAENSGLFVASVIDLYNSDTYLQKCAPGQVVGEALKAATLKLPINKQLGFAYIVPYKKNGEQIPQFQIGYKGYIQLAMRSGKYQCLNADVICEGEIVERDRLTGYIEFGGKATNDKPIGYFCHFELLNGFKKTLYMTKDQCQAWATKYSKSYSKANSPWKTQFDEMALKTVTRRLLSRYGIMSVDMISALSSDTEDPEAAADTAIANEANGEVIDIKPSDEGENPNSDGTDKDYKEPPF